MAITNLEELQNKVEDLSLQYTARFAGKSRATRSPEELEQIISDLSGAIEEGQALMNGGDNSAIKAVLDSANENLDLYKREKEAILTIQSQGDEIVTASLLATWANFVFDEYRRHFSGKNRSTRDLGRMEEMLAELDSIGEDMESLYANKPMDSVKADMETVERNIELYEQELEAIREARRSGTREQRVDTLADSANEQFRIYRDQFANKGRSSRRPELLDRVVNNLTEILREMRALNASGLRNSTNTRNIQIVQENLGLYRTEVEAIREARASLSPEDLAGNLGGAANEIMAEYRANFAGQDRATRDLDLLTAICDQMYEIAIQMRDVQDEVPELEMNNQNLSIVMDNLVLYHTEFRNILEAKGEA